MDVCGAAFYDEKSAGRIRYRLLRHLLEVLIIFAGIPVTTPGEAVFLKELVAEIIFINLIGKGLGTVSVDFTAIRRNVSLSGFSFVKDKLKQLVTNLFGLFCENVKTQ